MARGAAGGRSQIATGRRADATRTRTSARSSSELPRNSPLPSSFFSFTQIAESVEEHAELDR